MVDIFYDLHIHSALSPCAGDDMTPNDIVGMSILNGLDMIAVTDHNSMSNIPAVLKAAQTAKMQTGKELIVLPGIEISTAEEVHVVCLFYDLESAIHFENDFSPYLSSFLNRKDIFGNQIIYDENDRIIGNEERMLIAPATISFDELYDLTKKSNGVFIPAHIDRASFSVISNLGFLPPHLEINTVEISQNGIDSGFDKINSGKYAGKKMIFSSDAHQLWLINEKKYSFSLPEYTAKAAIDYLR